MDFLLFVPDLAIAFLCKGWGRVMQIFGKGQAPTINVHNYPASAPPEIVLVNFAVFSLPTHRRDHPAGDLLSHVLDKPTLTATHRLQPDKPTMIKLDWEKQIDQGYITCTVPDPYQIIFAAGDEWNPVPRLIPHRQVPGATTYAFEIDRDLYQTLLVTVVPLAQPTAPEPKAGSQ